MSEENQPNLDKAHRKLKIIGILALVWNCIGVMDFVLTNTRTESYIEAFEPEMLAFLESFPMWATAAWAVAVFAAAFGSLLLVMRKKLAAPVLVLALIGLLVSYFHKFVMHDGMKIMGGGGSIVMTIAIGAIASYLAYYANSLKDKGILS